MESVLFPFHLASFFRWAAPAGTERRNMSRSANGNENYIDRTLITPRWNYQRVHFARYRFRSHRESRIENSNVQLSPPFIACHPNNNGMKNNDKSNVHYNGNNFVGFFPFHIYMRSGFGWMHSVEQLIIDWKDLVGQLRICCIGFHFPHYTNYN